MNFDGVNSSLRVAALNSTSTDQLQMEKLRKLTPAQRKELSPQEIAYFYNHYPFQDIKINPAHFAKTLKQIPSLPQLSEGSQPPAALLGHFDMLYEKHKALFEQIAAKDFELSDIKTFRKGLETIVKTSEKGKKKENGEKRALYFLVVTIIKLIQDKPIEEVAEYLRDIAVGGRNCETGQFTQTYKVYLKILKLSNPENRILKALHDVRDNILDQIAGSRNSEDTSETVEEKSHLLTLYAETFGILSVSQSEEERREEQETLKRLQDPIEFQKYFDCLLAYGMPQRQVERQKIDIIEKIRGYGPTHTKFNELYTPNMILEYFRDSKEVYEWYLDGTENAKEYVFDHVLESGFTIKKEYLMLLLDNLEVLSFT